MVRLDRVLDRCDLCDSVPVLRVKVWLGDGLLGWLRRMNAPTMLRCSAHLPTADEIAKR